MTIKGFRLTPAALPPNISSRPITAALAALGILASMAGTTGCQAAKENNVVVLPPPVDSGWTIDTSDGSTNELPGDTSNDVANDGAGPDSSDTKGDTDGGCVPTTCEAINAACGEHDDGCGGTLDCDSACALPEDATLICNADFSCDYDCNSGFHGCTDTAGADYCADDTSPEACGETCTPCAVPENGVATCDAGTCGVSCSAGFDACNDTVCADLTVSAAHCGECNNFCPGGCLDSECIPEYELKILVGNEQVGVIDNIVQVPIQVQVIDNNSPVGGVDVEFIAPTGAAIDPPAGQTNPAGIAFASARLGREPGVYEFKARIKVAPQVEITFEATATVPNDGVIFSLVNWEHVSGNGVAPGPGTTARIGEPRGITVAADGTLYFTDWVNNAHKVRSLSPAGELTDIAGVAGSGGFAGDYGDALAAKLNQPTGIALDEAAGIVYVADYNNDRVRAIDLTNGTISTIAGGGSAVGPGYGDGGLAAFPPNGGAFIDGPTHLSLGPDGMLYVTDSKHDRIRRVDPVANTIDAFVSGVVNGQKCAGEIVLTDCATGCAMTWSDDGAMFLSGKFACGETEAKVNQGVPGIVRVDLDGTLHHVVGKLNGSGGNNIPAQSAALGNIEGLALDPVGNLIITEAETVRFIDAAIGRLTTIAGGATAGSLGDFGGALDAQLSTPLGVATWGRHVIVADRESFSIRTIWNAGAETASTAMLGIFGGDAQSAYVSEQFPAPLSAEITDDSGGTLPGVPVTFTSLDEGGGVVAPRSPAAANGVASIAARPGLIPGGYDFEASFRDIHGYHVPGSPVTFNTTALAADGGMLFTAVNTDGVLGDGFVPAPAALTRTGSISDVVVASDGTTYFTQEGSDLHRVRAMSPQGELYNIAGVGTDGFSGNNGPAVLAEFDSPTGLALDEAAEILYVADTLNNVVRAIELTGEKRITTHAGGGSADETTSYGDDGAAIMASLNKPTHLALAADGSLFITDSKRNRIRRVDATTGFITTVLARPETPNDITCEDTPGVPYLGDCTKSCALGVDAADNLWVMGEWGCIGQSPSTAGTTSQAIVAVSPAGVRTHYVGDSSGSPADTVAQGTDAKISIGEGIALDPAGNVYFSDGDHRVRRWDQATGALTTLAGQFNATTAQGMSGFIGDYGPATAGSLYNPRGVSVSPDGHLFIADFGNAAVRVIWGAAVNP